MDKVTPRIYGYSPTMPDKVYRALDAAHYSTLKLLCYGQTLLHARHAMLNPTPSTPDQIIGQAFHVQLLEAATFPERYYTTPVPRKSRNAFKEEVAKAGDRQILTAADALQVLQMVESILAHPRYGQLLRRAYDFEACAVAPVQLLPATVGKDATTVPVKAKLDYYAEDIATVVDPKTCQDASPAGFSKAIARFGYHIQATLYTIVMEALGLPVKHWVWIAIEKKEPYACAFHRCPDHIIEQTRPAVMLALEKMAAAYHADRWPGYSDDIEDIDLPPWALTALIEEPTL